MATVTEDEGEEWEEGEEEEEGEEGAAVEEEEEKEEGEEEGEEGDEEEEDEETEDIEDDSNWQEIKVKISCNNELRAMTLTSKTNYEHFLKTLVADYGEVVSLSYKDQEDDEVHIRSQHDLTIAYDYYLQTLQPAGKTLRLQLLGKKPAAKPQMATVSTPKVQPKPAAPTASVGKPVSRPVSGASRPGSANRGLEVLGSMSSLDSLESTFAATANKWRWKKGNLIGKGSFGTVYLGILENRGQLIAVKQVELGSVSSEKDLDAFVRELTLMRNLSHKNIVQYIGCEYDSEGKHLNILLEYVPGGSLQSLAKRFDGKLPENTIRHYTKQILEGLAYLHGQEIIHRDIKGDNILVDENGTIKLADFGCSKQLNDLCAKTHGCSTMVGTPYWMAPEVITDEGGYGFKADIWSVGCTVVEMMTGKPPWPEFESMWAAIYHIANSSGPPSDIPQDLSAEARDFLDRCFERNVQLRPSALELLEHPFCSTVLEDDVS